MKDIFRTLWWWLNDIGDILFAAMLAFYAYGHMKYEGGDFVHFLLCIGVACLMGNAASVGRALRNNKRRRRKIDYLADEAAISEAILNARQVQDFIWGHNTGQGDYRAEVDLDEWQALFQKRVDCIGTINVTHCSARVELRKRLLQQAGLSIRALVLLDAGEPLVRRRRR